MKAFGYSRPEHIDQALDAMQRGARPLAGGTDLLTLMKADIETPRELVDIRQLSGLDRDIQVLDDGLHIGALATLAALEEDPRILADHAALAQAAAVAATPQLRNAATIGGNLLQQPRCWYFRSPQLRCWRRGGESCPARGGENRLHALFGGDPCCAVHPSDPAAALMALDATVRLHGRDGARDLSLESFFALPTGQRRQEVRLGDDELLVSLRLPAANGRSVYLKAMDRRSWAFALVGVAAHVRLEGGRVADARIVLSGVAPIPWRVPAAEQALVAGESPERVAEVALDGAAPLRHNAFKLPLARALVRRAVAGLLVACSP